PKIPVLGIQTKRIPYRILELKNDGKIAVICKDMTVLDNGQRTVLDVNVEVLGDRSVEVGDIIAYAQEDTGFLRPVILHRWHQKHQHPDHLIAPDER
ncbi:MAG: hypothetical protein KGJ13_11690, partial [Patescibacteria group bacterium]|nr:hypothetical protein [Patescibacteria group bacterium]